MNKTYSDMMGEYQHIRNAVRCYTAWDNLDQFVENLIKQVAPKIEKSVEKGRHSFDANGSEIDG